MLGELRNSESLLEEVFGSKIRLKIISTLLREGPMNITRLVRITGLNHVAVRKGLESLKLAGIVQEENMGGVRLYRVNRESTIIKLLEGLYGRGDDIMSERRGKTPRMVDISEKDVVFREAMAYGRIRLKKETIVAIKEGKIEKGDPLAVAAIAGILAAKKTPSLLPMCHPIEITKVDVECKIEDENHVGCTALVRAIARTGVEMEALTAVSIALLNVWDMVKKLEKDEKGLYPQTLIEQIKVVSKIKKGTGL